MQRQNRVQFESKLAKAMLEEIVTNTTIKSVLIEIASQLNSQVLTQICTDVDKSEQQSQELSVQLKAIFASWSIQHSKDDAFIGALLPQHSLQELRDTTQGRAKLLVAMMDKLSYGKIDTHHDVITLIKTIDSMGFYYVSDAFSKSNLSQYELIKDMLFPTIEESDMRCLRDEKTLAVTYGIGTELNKDLVRDFQLAEGCFSGKARFFIPSAEKRFEKLIDQYDMAVNNENEIVEKELACKLLYYGIPLNKHERNHVSSYAKRHTPWFQKLAREKFEEKALPLIGSVSFSTSRALITLLHLGAFNKKSGEFDLDKAQIFANCLMGYFVFCGHHSFVEVAEIWNRLLDYVAIYHPEQLPQNTFLTVSSNLRYMDNPCVEQLLPYARIGDYSHFLHASYADNLLQRIEMESQNCDEELWGRISFSPF